MSKSKLNKEEIMDGMDIQAKYVVMNNILSAEKEKEKSRLSRDFSEVK